MSFTIDVTSDFNRLKHYMEDLEKKQLPFAASLTLNKLAVKAQEAISHNIPQLFNNRKTWWHKNQPTGIKVQFSHKHNLVSAVYTRAYFAKIQEEGGIKKPYRGNNLAIPTEHVLNSSRNSKALRSTQSEPNVFKLGKSIYCRSGNKQLKRLYSLTPQAHVKARFHFKDTAMSVFRNQFDQLFTRSFNYALRTAK